MARIWDYVYWRLPVGKRQFFDKANNLLEKADSLKQILESGVKIVIIIEMNFIIR